MSLSTGGSFHQDFEDDQYGNISPQLISPMVDVSLRKLDLSPRDDLQKKVKTAFFSELDQLTETPVLGLTCTSTTQSDSGSRLVDSQGACHQCHSCSILDTLSSSLYKRSRLGSPYEQSQDRRHLE